MDFISIPLHVSLKGTPVLEREKGTLEESIDNILDLIVFTPKGAFPADPEFGFEYWNHEFSNINIREFNNNYIGLIPALQKKSEISRKDCEDSIRNSIINYEPRLQQPEVKIALDSNGRNRYSGRKSKYEMHIVITGSIDEGLGVCRQYEKKISFLVEPVVRQI